MNVEQEYSTVTAILALKDETRRIKETLSALAVLVDQHLGDKSVVSPLDGYLRKLNGTAAVAGNLERALSRLAQYRSNLHGSSRAVQRMQRDWPDDVESPDTERSPDALDEA